MNSITIIGRLTKDAELKEYKNNKGDTNKLCNFSVAVNRAFGDEADFFNCTAFGKRGEVIEKFFKKGSQIALRGQMQSSKKDDKIYWNVLVEEFDFCGSSQGKAKTTDNTADTFEQIDEDVPF